MRSLRSDETTARTRFGAARRSVVPENVTTWPVSRTSSVDVSVCTRNDLSVRRYAPMRSSAAGASFSITGFASVVVACGAAVAGWAGVVCDCCAITPSVARVTNRPPVTRYGLIMSGSVLGLRDSTPSGPRDVPRNLTGLVRPRRYILRNGSATSRGLAPCRGNVTICDAVEVDDGRRPRDQTSHHRAACGLRRDSQHV